MPLTEVAHDPTLYNHDLAPVPPSRRTWGIYNYASLWVAMSVCIPTYMLASGLIAGGMSWKQAIGTILLGNLIVLIPMLLNAHAGAKYGIPFPVFVRASFGVRGANVPAVLRAIVACGWFGIQTWIGGQAIYSMLRILLPAAASSAAVPWLCFFAFWGLNLFVIWRGIDTIKFLEGIGAPFMLGIGLLLLWWITRKAGGLGPVLSTPSKFATTAQFIRFFIPSLTGMVGFWATVALNIPDFTRYAKSQKAQAIGQAIGLPPAMTLYAFIGVAVTSALGIFMCAFGGWLADRYGGYRTFFLFTTIFALISYPFFAYVLAEPGFGRLFVAQFVVLTVFGLLQGSGPGLNAGLFPVEVRSTGMAIAYNVGVTVFGGFAPLTVTWLIDTTGSKLVPAYYIIAAAVLSIVVVASTYRRVRQGGG